MRNRRSAKTGNWSLRRRREREAFEKTWTATLTLSPSLSLNPDLLQLSFPNPTRNSTPTARTSPSAATPFRTLPRPWSTSGSRPRGRSRRRRPCGRRRLTSRRRRRHCARPLLRRWRRAKEGLRSQVLRRRWCWQQLITKHDEKSETRAARLVIQKPPPSEPELFFHSFFWFRFLFACNLSLCFFYLSLPDCFDSSPKNIKKEKSLLLFSLAHARA